jgi:hypothetical protein
MLDYFPKGWVGESCMLCDAYLFIQQFHASSFGASWWGEMASLFFSVARHREAFQDVKKFDSD